MIRNLSALVSGIIFGFGLAVSGMIDPSKVVGFLDVTGAWDPSLALVMGGAVAVTGVAFRFVLARPGSILGDRFRLPQKTKLDNQLILGAAIFGVGWGLSGFCPGPAIASLAFLEIKIIAFVSAMVLGSAVAQKVLTEQSEIF